MPPAIALPCETRPYCFGERAGAGTRKTECVFTVIKLHDHGGGAQYGALLLEDVKVIFPRGQLFRCIEKAFLFSSVRALQG